MNCSRYHFLLSMQLDGRLSSTKRDALDDHLDVCTACAKLAAEMRVAQDLVQRLSHSRVNSSFQATLWERIESGEGTPNAVFDEPVPLVTRLRYVGAGAAAAALFLLALNLINGPDAAEPTGATRDSASASETEVARRPPEPTASHRFGADRPSRAFARFDETAVFAEPLNARNVANFAQVATVRNVNELKTRAPRIRQRLQAAPSLNIRGEIEGPVRELRSSVLLMRWLVDEDLVDLPGDFQAELRLAEHGVQLVDRASGQQELAVALDSFADVNTDNLNRRFKIACCDSASVFLERFSEHVERNPEVGCVLHVTLTDTDIGQQLQVPLNNSMFRYLVLRSAADFPSLPREQVERLGGR